MDLLTFVSIHLLNIKECIIIYNIFYQIMMLLKINIFYFNQINKKNMN